MKHTSEHFYECPECGGDLAVGGHMPNCERAAAKPQHQEDAMKILPGELAFVQVLLEGLSQIATYSPASTVQPVQIARDTLRRANALTFESEPLRAEIENTIGNLPESLRNRVTA